LSTDVATKCISVESRCALYDNYMLSILSNRPTESVPCAHVVRASSIWTVNTKEDSLTLACHDQSEQREQVSDDNDAINLCDKLSFYHFVS